MWYKENFLDNYLKVRLGKFGKMYNLDFIVNIIFYYDNFIYLDKIGMYNNCFGRRFDG